MVAGVTNLDIDVLRSFATGVELGSFARAADRLGRSTSAISAQLKKLEEQVGQPVLRKSGRGLALTATGEIVLSYARRLLELNDAAVLAVRGAQLVGSVRVGFQEDFGEALLSEVLGRFARTHPAVTVDARIARNEELANLLALARLDLVLSWQAGTPGPYPQSLGRLPMRWIGDPLLVATQRIARAESLCLWWSSSRLA
jgi:DNA-binding transcriptional LysR family regulator